jgi:hypothetical protein
MQPRDEEEDGRSPFRLEALEAEAGARGGSPDVEGLVRHAARASRGLSRRARRHLRRALHQHLLDSGTSALEAEEALDAESPFLGEGEDESFDDESGLELESPFLAGEAGEPGLEFDTPPALDPATNVDALAAEPEFSPALRKRLYPVLAVADATRAVTWNASRHPRVSEIPLAHLRARLETYVDRPSLEAALGAKVDDATLTAQLAQQFQRKAFRESGFHTGRLDEATLDALGFVRHRGGDLNKADRGNAAASRVLGRAVTRALAAPFGQDLTARTWFRFMLDAPFLGLTTRGGLGIHLVLMRKLREAQAHLWTLPKYRDLSPVELGDALLWDATDDPTPRGTTWTAPRQPDAKLGDRHRGARPGTPGASMHLPGLAVDLGYRANPWIGSLSFKAVAGRAATLVGGTVLRANGTRVRAARDFGELTDAHGLGRKALHMLSQGALTTGQIYDTLAQWNAWLERYLEMGTSDAALTAAIQARQADGTADVMKGDLPRTLAHWRRQIRADLESLRKNSFSAAGTPRDPRKGFLSFHRDLVIALREKACLAWGAVDLGGGEKGSGDIMHFDCRVDGLGRAFVVKAGVASVPTVHPCVAPPVSRAGVRKETEPTFEADVPGGDAPRKKTPPRKAEPPPKAPALKQEKLQDHLGAAKGKLYSLAFPKDKGGRTAVFVPDAAAGADPLTLFVFIHGNQNVCKGEGPDAVSYVQSVHFSLVKILSESGRPWVAVVPSMNWTSTETHVLRSPGNMNTYLDLVRRSLAGAGWSTAPEVGRVVLAGHSRAYVVLDALAGSTESVHWQNAPLARLTDVWSLDSMYSRRNCAAEKWTIWAATRRTSQFRVYYLKDGRTKAGKTIASPTAPEAQRMKAKADAAGLDNLKVFGIARDDDPNTLDHCLMPPRELPSLIRQAAKP